MLWTVNHKNYDHNKFGEKDKGKYLFRSDPDKQSFASNLPTYRKVPGKIAGT